MVAESRDAARPSATLARAVVVAAALVSVAPGYLFSAPTTIYAAPGGSDALSCTAAQNIRTPKRTVNSAVGCLSAGGTLLIRSGVYPEALLDNIPAGTSWSSPVTVAAYPGEKVTLRPNRGAGSILHFQAPQQYIVVDGLILDGSNVGINIVKITYGSDPATSAAHHIRIANSELMYAPSQAILVNGDGGHNEFINLKVHDNGETDFSHGFYIANDYNLIDHCEIYRNAGWGMQLFGDKPHHNIVRNNRVSNNARAGKRGPGIGVYGSDNLVYNNVVWGNNGGFECNGATNTALYNNTFFRNNGGNGGHAGLAVGSCTDTTVRNNIVYQNSLDLRGTRTVADHNLIGVDPLFVNSEGLDFRLQQKSPAIDGGAMIASVATDAGGVKRPQGKAFDIGAHEFSEGTP